jgi:outer membrane protein assembly factor BamB
MFKRIAWCLPICLVCAVALHAAKKNVSVKQPHDWPQWRGQNRDAASSETDLLTEWSKQGPPLAWEARNLGGGFSSVAVSGGKVFTMGDRGDEQQVIALDEKTGKELWAGKVGPPWKGRRGPGPRGCPAVDGGRVYALGTDGDLVCLDEATGAEHWHKNLPRDFGGRMMSGWGYSESPLVDGGQVICTPGGKKATLVALNKETGDTIWEASVPQGDGAAYSSAIVADINGQRQYIQFLQRGVVGVSAKDGKFLWRYDKPANGTANCATPLCHADFVFAASAYGKGGGLVKLIGADDSIKAKEVYSTKQIKNHHGGMVLVDGYLYGANGGNGETPALVCLEFQTGKVMWEARKAGKGSLAYADGHLYYRTENGPVVLVDASPKAYTERGRFNQPERKNAPAWAHPVLANGKLYLRDQDILLCYDVKQHQRSTR